MFITVSTKTQCGFVGVVVFVFAIMSVKTALWTSGVGRVYGGGFASVDSAIFLFLELLFSTIRSNCLHMYFLLRLAAWFQEFGSLTCWCLLLCGEVIQRTLNSKISFQFTSIFQTIFKSLPASRLEIHTFNFTWLFGNDLKLRSQVH